ncbi:hypothetical protein A2U01_0081093, partial [Trifolium medium]|nr:hypothetical protein [Trifolium medium]
MVITDIMEELREEVTTLRVGMDRLTAMVQTTVIYEVVTVPTSVPPVSAPQYQMP